MIDQHWIGVRIDALRSQGKSQNGLAAALGLPKSRGVQLVTGARRVRVDELPAVAAYLDVSIAKVLQGLGVDGVAASPRPSCSFCGKGPEGVFLLLRGPGDAAICDECADVAAWAAAEHRDERRAQQLEEIRRLGT